MHHPFGAAYGRVDPTKQIPSKRALAVHATGSAGVKKHPHPGKHRQRANGAYHTPWSVCAVMTEMLGPIEPGKSVCDPCCGSGRMLLAALENCRRNHSGQPDPGRVRLRHRRHRRCRLQLNLRLAGYTPRVGMIAPAYSDEGKRILEPR